MDNPLNKDLTNYVLAKNYKLIKKLGAGAFGEIYLGHNKQNKEEYAIKLERGDTKHPQIFFEAKLYSYLQQSEINDKGIPRIFGQGTDGQFNYMVMDLLGESLEDLFTKHNRKFSLKTVLMIGDQMLQRIEFIHSKQFLHRDIKPDNFLMGYSKKAHRVYIVDFGLAKRYITKEGHIPYKEGKSLTGTARYASINTHMGLEQSRRDDLESLGYVLLYFLRGQLPWQNMKANNQKDKYERIMEKKMETSSEALCRGFPTEFVQYMNYSKNLKFEDKPDYNFLKTLFKDALKKAGHEIDFKYDWIKSLDPSNIPSPRVEETSQQFSSFQKAIIVVPQKNTRQTTEEKKMSSLNSSQKMPPSHSNQIQPIIQRRPTQRNTQANNEKTGRNASIKHSTSQQNNFAQIPPNKIPQPKIVTTKQPYQKF